MTSDQSLGDKERNDHPFWKQGGSFFRECITWTIASNYDETADADIDQDIADLGDS